jgi:acetoin utilization deacetylase AcuC-like enzyme
MNILAAKSTKDIWHKGNNGNVYQLDSITNQLNIEKRLLEEGHVVRYIDSASREEEAKGLVHQVHDKKYLDVFKQETTDDVYLSNGLMLQKSLYPLALEHALIAKDLVDMAKSEKSSFSTIGGGHHCEYGKPLGFGLVNTMAISATYATSLGEKVALLDLDTHYSNGCNDLLKHKESILMCSLWNQVIPAWKYYEKQDNLIHEKVNDIVDYFEKLDNLLKSIKLFQPSLLIYHLGFDVLDTDRMGGVIGMNEEELLKRETIVRAFMDAHQIPSVIYRGGGYTKYCDGAQVNKERQDKLLKTQMAAINQYL